VINMRRVALEEQIKKQKEYRKKWYQENKEKVKELNKLKKENPEAYKKLLEVKKNKLQKQKLKSTNKPKRKYQKRTAAHLISLLEYQKEYRKKVAPRVGAWIET